MRTNQAPPPQQLPGNPTHAGMADSLPDVLFFFLGESWPAKTWPKPGRGHRNRRGWLNTHENMADIAEKNIQVASSIFDFEQLGDFHHVRSFQVVAMVSGQISCWNWLPIAIPVLAWLMFDALQYTFLLVGLFSLSIAINSPPSLWNDSIHPTL